MHRRRTGHWCRTGDWEQGFDRPASTYIGTHPGGCGNILECVSRIKEDGMQSTELAAGMLWVHLSFKITLILVQSKVFWGSLNNVSSGLVQSVFLRYSWVV